MSKRLALSLRSFALLASLLSTQVSAKAAELETVPYVDVEQYLGKWYEIARLPQIFQPACTAVSAEYSLNEDGSIKVYNSCRILDPNQGFPISIEGRATPTDESQSKLDVSFFNGLAKGKYWVLELDPNYQWALVGDPLRVSLYVLSRKTSLEPEIYERLLELAQNKHGYQIKRLIKTKHKLD